ncbi:MAG: DUF4198 domain-containing protein [Bryobacteraceae bacterium]
MKIASTLLFVAAAAASGHDMYIMPGNFRPAMGSTIPVGFHVGDSFPDSEVNGRLDRLNNPRLIWRGGSAPFRNLRVDGKRNVGDVVVGGSGALIAAVHTAPSLIDLEPKKFEEYLHEEGLTEVLAWRAKHGESVKPGKERYSKYAKAILLSGNPNGFADHAVGLLLEILPEADPHKIKAGGVLPIRVLFRGKPAANLQIESAWAGAKGGKTKIVGRTAADGRLKVPLAEAGKWRIHTIQMERCAEPAVADWESFWASMTFELR